MKKVLRRQNPKATPCVVRESEYIFLVTCSAAGGQLRIKMHASSELAGIHPAGFLEPAASRDRRAVVVSGRACRLARANEWQHAGRIRKERSVLSWARRHAERNIWDGYRRQTERKVGSGTAIVSQGG